MGQADALPHPPDWIRDAVETFQRPLTQYATRLLGDADRAHDVVQETFLRLCDQDPRAVATHLAEWLYTVCRNRSMDVRRKEKRMSLLNDQQAATFVAHSPDPGHRIEQADNTALLLKLLDRLPHNQRETIVLKFQHGFSYEQISRVTNLSVSNVGYLIHTGLKTLRRQAASAH